jgi:hypothetical protein
MTRVAVLFTVAGAQAAFADDAADISAARQFGIEGVTLAEQGQCAQAVDRLTRAEKLHHAPTTAERLGECEVELGKLVAGTERLQRVLREPLTADSPPAFVEARARASRVLKGALPRVASLRISVHAPAGVGFSVAVDAEPISEVFLDNPRPTDPGTHEVSVSAEGHLTSKSSVRLGDGESAQVNLTLEVDPNAALRKRTPPKEPEVVDRAPAAHGAGTHPLKVGGGVALGIGAAGLAFGVVAGVLVSGHAAKLQSGCTSQDAAGHPVCPDALRTELDEAKRWSMLSTVGYAVGGGIAAVGLLLILLAPSSSEAAAGVALTPQLGLGYLGIAGRF